MAGPSTPLSFYSLLQCTMLECRHILACACLSSANLDGTVRRRIGYHANPAVQAKIYAMCSSHAAFLTDGSLAAAQQHLPAEDRGHIKTDQESKESLIIHTARKMATINFDSELLRQPWEEKLLDGALDCRAVHDYLSRPVIFTLLKSGKLLLLAQDDKAELCVLDLSAQFGLKPTEKVSAIAVSQAKSLEIHVVFATTDQDAITFSKLWVLPGFVPASPTWLENVKTMTAFQGPQSDSSLISKLLLVSPTIYNSFFPLSKC